MLIKYLNEAAPLIQPAAVETKVAGTIGGVRVYGYVDLLAARGVIDLQKRIAEIETNEG